MAYPWIWDANEPTSFVAHSYDFAINGYVSLRGRSYQKSGDESHAYLDQQLCCQHCRWVVCGDPGVSTFSWKELFRMACMGCTDIAGGPLHSAFLSNRWTGRHTKPLHFHLHFGLCCLLPYVQQLPHQCWFTLRSGRDGESPCRRARWTTSHGTVILYCLWLR